MRRHNRSSKKTPRSPVRNWLQLAQLRYEKCELAEARVAYEMALKRAKREGDLSLVMEAIAGLLRLAADALDDEAIRRWDRELDHLVAEHSREVPPMVWYCKGVITRRAGDYVQAQRYVHRYVRMVRASRLLHSRADDLAESKTAEARGWVLLATLLWARGRVQRARWLAEQILSWPDGVEMRGIRGLTEMLLGNICEQSGDLEGALAWFQRAHGSFLGEHSWIYHLYVLYGYARLFRKQKNYAQAYWHLDLVDKATTSSGFGLLKKEIADERARLEQDAVDLLIDSRQALIKTRESRRISLGKQYVLLHILEALSDAHGKPGDDADRGLSKAEIIERVWKERYRPEAHDNKLYYNINRLRRLIEPDVRNPQYLLNWKEGYRLAPGLKVHFV